MIVQKTDEWLPGIRGGQGLTTREQQEGVFSGAGTACILTGAYGNEACSPRDFQNPENCVLKKGNFTGFFLNLKRFRTPYSLSVLFTVAACLAWFWTKSL